MFIRSLRLIGFLSALFVSSGCSTAENWVRFDRAINDILSPTSPNAISRTIAGTLGASAQSMDLLSTVNVDLTGLSAGDTSTIYTDNTCTNSVGTASLTIAGTLPVPATLSANGSYTFYTIIEDSNGAKTACLPTTVTYKKVRGFTVSTTATPTAADSNTADGICNDGTGACTLLAALDEAQAGTDEALVKVPAGTYLMPTEITTGVGNHAVTVRGVTGTILDGQNTTRMLTIGGTPTGTGNLTFDNIVFQNGRKDSSGFWQTGGAINIQSFMGTPTNRIVIKNCLFKNNTAYSDGGAIYLRGNYVDIQRTKFEGNNISNSGEGVAILAKFAQNVTFDEIEVTSHTTNPAFALGLITLDHSTNATFKNSTLMSNTSTRTTLYLNECDGCVVSNTTVANNNGRGLSVLVNTGQTTTITSSTFSDNGLGNLTGLNRSMQLTMLATGSTAVYNTIMHITNLTGKNFQKSAGTFTAENLIINDSSHGISSGVTEADPLLGALAANGGFSMTMIPGATSPAIDGGSLARCTALDQRGQPRPKSAGGVGPFCDVGAVEVQ